MRPRIDARMALFHLRGPRTVRVHTYPWLIAQAAVCLRDQAGSVQLVTPDFGAVPRRIEIRGDGIALTLWLAKTRRTATHNDDVINIRHTHSPDR